MSVTLWQVTIEHGLASRPDGVQLPLDERDWMGGAEATAWLLLAARRDGASLLTLGAYRIYKFEA